MSAASYQAPAGNGTGAEPAPAPSPSRRRGGTRKAPVARRASTGKPEAAPAPPAPDVASFVSVEARAVDAPMWPVHPVAWLQPELRPGDPGLSGLHIERHHRFPAPGFLQLAPTPASPPLTADTARDPLLPNAKRACPQSGLAPLGWDPRAASVSDEKGGRA